LEVVQPLPRQPPDPLELPAEELAVASVASIASQAHQGVETEEPPKKHPTNPKPAYPPEALRAGWQGRVVLRVLVSEVGTVTAVSVETSSGYRVLDEAAMAAMRSWRFTPAARSGRAVPHEGLHGVRFRLEDP
jgi:protein TonB